MRWRRAWPVIAVGLVVIAAALVPIRQVLTISAGGELLAVWPAEAVTITYVHSIDHLPIEEDLRVRDGELIVERTRLKEFGAGMGQIEGEGTGRAEGEWWVIDDLDRVIGSELHIRAGAIGVDHRITNGDQEIPLSACWAGTRITVAVERVPMTRYALRPSDSCES